MSYRLVATINVKSKYTGVHYVIIALITSPLLIDHCTNCGNVYF